MLYGRLHVTVRDLGTGVIDETQFPAYRVYYNGELAADQVEGTLLCGWRCRRSRQGVEGEERVVS